MEITDQTPIGALTVGQLKELLSQRVQKTTTTPPPTTTGKEYVYGLAGIKKLFNVSHATAQRYKDGILRDAVSQQGRVIMTDVEKARQLFSKSRNR